MSHDWEQPLDFWERSSDSTNDRHNMTVILCIKYKNK